MAEGIDYRWRTYDWWLEKLPANGGEMKLEADTFARLTDQGVVSVRLHNTAIVTVSPENIARLYTGGWNTYKTKLRLNSLLPAGITIYEHEKQWYVLPRTGVTQVFRSPMYLDLSTGAILPDPVPADNYSYTEVRNG